MMGPDGILDEKTLPREVRERGEKKKPEEEQKPGVEARQSDSMISEEPLTLKELEYRAIRKAIERCGNTTQGKKEAARKLGIGLATLYRKLEEITNSQNEN